MSKSKGLYVDNEPSIPPVTCYITSCHCLADQEVAMPRPLGTSPNWRAYCVPHAAEKNPHGCTSDLAPRSRPEGRWSAVGVTCEFEACRNLAEVYISSDGWGPVVTERPVVTPDTGPLWGITGRDDIITRDDPRRPFYDRLLDAMPFRADRWEAYCESRPHTWGEWSLQDFIDACALIFPAEETGPLWG